MGRSRDYRGPRRRRYDDEEEPPPFFAQRESPRPAPSYGSRSPAAPSAPGLAAQATVKWFNPEKGFGFVELAGGAGDAFLHIAVLQASGHEAVSPGASLDIEVGQGAKGAQVTRVISVDQSTAVERPPRPAFGGGGGDMDRGPRPPRRQRPDPATAVEMTGSVKWFNPEKGFGFVACEDGGKDVFLHISVLSEAGLSSLDEGQQVTMRVVETPKGREAISVDAG